MLSLLAQSQINDNGWIFRGFGSYGLETQAPGQAPSIFNSFLTSTIGILTVIAGIWFFFVLITGAIMWIGAGGDKGKVAEARQRITMGIIGMVVVVAALFIADIVGGLLGFPDILDPGSLIQVLGPP
jgi:hypothetical protein